MMCDSKNKLWGINIIYNSHLAAGHLCARLCPHHSHGMLCVISFSQVRSD